MSEQPQARQVSPVEEIRVTLDRMIPEFQVFFPPKDRADHVRRFLRVVMNAVHGNPELLECDRKTFYMACLDCARDGLLPDKKQAFINIRSVKVSRQGEPDRWVKTACYEPMWQGMALKLRNSGQLAGAPRVHDVRERDQFTYELGDNERIVHVPYVGPEDSGKVIAAYSIVKLKDGEISREVMHISAIMQVREHSKAKNSGPWSIGSDGKHSTEFGEQCRKTVFRRHCKRLPSSTDLDNVLKSSDAEFNYEDPQPAQERRQEPAASPAGSTGGERRPAALERVVASQNEDLGAQVLQQGTTRQADTVQAGNGETISGTATKVSPDNDVL